MHSFVSDYYRLQILYENGGIYFDTDVEARKDFSELLEKNTGLLLGFIYDSLIGTAVIGAEEGNQIILELMSQYEDASWRYNNKTGEFKIILKQFGEKNLQNNNDLFTAYFLKYIPEFKLNGKGQKINNISIYPKEYFEGYSFDSRHN